MRHLRNKKWLADKLFKDIEDTEKSKSKDDILIGIERGINDIKNGRVYPIDQLWNQLQGKQITAEN